MSADWPAPVVVRLAGLPAVAAGELRFSRTAAQVASLLDEQARLRYESDALAADLYDVIGNLPDPAAKPGLVGLRRAVHGQRQPVAGEWNPRVARLLPPAVTGRVHTWRDLLQRVRQARALVAPTLTDEMSRQETILREVASDPWFRRALGQASPALSTELEKWLADPARRPRRQVVFRLAKFVARAATKTSPYSTFAVSGFGRWSAAGPRTRLTLPAAPEEVLEIHEGVRARLADGLARQPEVWPSLLVRINPSATIDGDRIHYLGRPPREPLHALPVTPALRRCLDLLAGEDTTTLGELQDRLAGEGAAAGTDVRRFLTHLVDNGLLEVQLPALGPGNSRADPGNVTGWLPADRMEHHAAVADLLDRTTTALAGASPATGSYRPLPRRRTLPTLRALVSDLSSRLGLPPADPEEPVAMDSAVATGPLAVLAAPAWRPVVEDLDALRQWLAVFNAALPVKLVLTEFWRRHVDRPQLPFLLLHRAIQEAVAAGSPIGRQLQELLTRTAEPESLAGSDIGSLRQLHSLREETLQVLARAPDDDGTVRVAPAALRAVAARWPTWVDSLDSIGCYVQQLPGGEGHAAVLNAVDLGYGRGRSRVARLVQLAGGEPPADGAWMADRPGPVLAELAGTHGSTFNDRAPAVPYDIDYPFTPGEPPPSRRLRLSDLVVAYDPDRGELRLRSRRLGREVTPLHLGMLGQAYLPAAARLLVRAFGQSLAIGGVWWLAGAGVLSPAQQVRHHPRAAVGRVVVRRAAWSVASAGVPVRHPGEHDADYLVRLAAWRRQAGLPSRCFVRVVPAGAAGGAGNPWLTKARKPVFIDFDSWFLVLVLENMLRGPAAVVIFEEALPDPTAAGGAADEVVRAAELLLEVSRNGCDDA